MKHYGDITKLHGWDLPIVDVITGGSPCQDLSVAGARAGLDGERSGLFMEQIRIVKEMREYDARTNQHGGISIRPRFMVWENVPGAFSSNNGEDFRRVLEEVARIADSTADIPRPTGGRWSAAGIIMGNGYSIAWRVHDAQFWGVPQRRKRIALVADFGGSAAPEVLFERKSLSGDTRKSNEEREETSAATGRGVKGTMSFQERAGKPGGVKEYSFSENEQALSQPSTIKECLQDQPTLYDAFQYCGWRESAVSGALQASQNDSIKNNTPLVIEPRSADGEPRVHDNGVCPTLDTMSGGQRQPCVLSHGCTVAIEGNGSRPSHNGEGISEGEVMFTLNSTEVHGVFSTNSFGGYSEAFPRPRNSGGDNGGGVKCSLYQKTVGALQARDYKGVGTQYVNEEKIIIQENGTPNNNRSSARVGRNGSDRHP